MDRLTRLAIFSALITTSWSVGAFAEQPGNFVLDAVIAGSVPEAAGQWRTKVQSVFDPATLTLSRRSYSVWDNTPSRDLDFTWQPDDPKGDKAGRINGSGHLVWLDRSKPAYDPSSVVGEYQGTLNDGRMEGDGTYIDSAGLKYQGQWRRGLMDGRGTLQLPAGDEYVGQFAKGKALGDGRLIDITGEIYDGRFLNGWRHGRGTTTLPNGSSYASFWIEGKESERSRLVRIAQSGSGSLANPSDDVRIGIAVEKRLPPQVRSSRRALWYEAANSTDGFQIRPADSRLLKMWKEKAELQLSFVEEVLEDGMGVLSRTREQLVPLNLRLELQNRSRSPIQVTGVYLDVKDSAAEMKPAIQVMVGTIDGCRGTAAYSSGFTLQNFGWGTAEAVVLKLNAANPQGGPGAFSISKKPGDIDKTIRVDIESDLKAMGVDTNYLKGLEEQGFACKSKTPRQCLTELRATGKFGQLANNVDMKETNFVLKLASVLEYSWRDAKGNLQNWTHPFTTTLPLGFLKETGECGELGGPQIITTKPQQFKLDTKAYKIPISYQATVAPSRTIPLVFPVEAPKSSSHDFTVVIQLADGREIRSRPISLLYYRPSWFIEEEPEVSEGDGNGITLANTGLNGTELQQIKGLEEEQCSAACGADAKCLGHTYDYWTRLCSLKSQITSTRSDPRVTSTLKKGIKRPVVSDRPAIVERYEKRKFEGHEFLAGLNSSVGECEQSCRTERGCSAYNFVTTTKICYLVERDVSKPSSSAATSSGVKFQPAQ